MHEQSPLVEENSSDITEQQKYGFREGYDVLGSTVNGETELHDLSNTNEDSNSGNKGIDWIQVPGITPLSGNNPPSFSSGLVEPPDPSTGAYDGAFGRTPDSGFFHQKQERKIFDHDLDIQVRDRQKWEHQLQEMGLLWGSAAQEAQKDLSFGEPVRFRHGPVPRTELPMSSVSSTTNTPLPNQLPADGYSPSLVAPTPVRTYRYTPAEIGPTELFSPPISSNRFSSSDRQASRHRGSSFVPQPPSLSHTTAHSPLPPSLPQSLSSPIQREPMPSNLESAVEESQRQLHHSTSSLPSVLSDISHNRFIDPDSTDLVKMGKSYTFQ